MARAEDTEVIDLFEEFYRNYYRNEIGELAQKYPNEQKSLYIDWQDLYRFDPDLADDYRNHPGQFQDYAEEALRLYDLPVDVKLGQAHVRVQNLPETTGIRDIRADHRGKLIAVTGIVRKATDVRPKVTTAAFECQRCGTLTRIPQTAGDFQEPHECQGCERQGPFRINYDQSEFVDAQKLRVQESPEGLRGGETPQSIDVNIEDDITGEVTAGDHVRVSGELNLDQQGGQQEKSPMFDVYMDGSAVTIEDEQFEDMDITDEDKKEIVSLSEEEDIYETMVDSIAPSIYGYRQAKLAMILQLFSGVTKHLPDESRIRGDLHMLLIGDPGTGKSQMLQYIREIAPRSVYTSGKGSSSAGLTAAAVRDDFGDGQQWTLEAGALVLADQGIAAVDELDKMRCVTGDTLVHLGDGRICRIGELAKEKYENGQIEQLPNGQTIRDLDIEAWTMTDDGQLVRRPVTAIHEYDAPEGLTRVTLQSGERLTATEDHPFFVFEDGERVEKPAGELKSDDWVYVPRRLSEPAADGGVATASDLAVDTKSQLSPSLAAVLGYLSGDGNVYYDRSEGVYGIRFTNAEEELLTDFERACRDAFDTQPIRPVSEQRADGVETVRVSGKEYADAVLDAGMNLETYDGKRLPAGVSTAGGAAKAAFIRAFADSEGTVDDRNVKLHSASYELLLGTKHLLLEFGISSQIQTRERDDRRDLYVLAITDAESLAAFDRYVGFTLDRKQQALEDVVEAVSGDRTILDVVPDVGETLREIRESLCLYQSECGIDDATYCNFENGDANISLRAARTVLETFKERKQEGQADRQRIENADWSRLVELRERYHVSQRQIADGTRYSQQQVSRLWGVDEALRECVRERLSKFVTAVAETDLSGLQSLVYGDVKWRKVQTAETVSSTKVNEDQILLQKQQLADLLGCDTDVAEQRARQLLSADPATDTWDDLDSTLDTYGISYQDIANDLGVAGSTVSRWFNDVVETDRIDDVRQAVEDRTAQIREEATELLDSIEYHQEPKVYDLTVEGTHNFVANGMVIHNSEDRSAMHEALEQQSISVSKAGINATLKSRCSLLGAANPKYGRFDQYEPIAEQIDLEPALISRFDLIFTVTDKPDEEEDRNLAEHILTTNYAGELNTHRTETSASDYTEEEVERVTDEVAPEIDAELLRKYVAYAKRNVFPTMTEEAKAEIREFYVDLRSQGSDEDAPVPVTARKLEALVRLAEASARIRLSDTVEVDDARRVIEIVQRTLEDIGMDPETGELDADVIETGTSKSQRDRIKNLKTLIGEIEEEYDEGAPVERVLERAEEAGMERSKAEHEIDKLKQQGEVYEPRNDHLRTT
ncbi:XRE family transcriptional regulator [Halorientalis sp. IM1011]|uniref:LAGLIDADG family homing endonuclease n=1 Tax=Halorientalis sp. IM1011 TaxID=1932360 RepID=UPI00097CD0B6|nr:LAGLIDADG family homing endonuclease [Halorientalis sp. IM1011]AQL42946.1 XRE family transcriptional regulator [Halorientalis sp. IM1011]